MIAELLAALLLPCRFHVHGESRLPSGAQFCQGPGAVRQRWAGEADVVPTMRRRGARRPFAWNASGCLSGQ